MRTRPVKVPRSAAGSDRQAAARFVRGFRDSPGIPDVLKRPPGWTAPRCKRLPQTIRDPAARSRAEVLPVDRENECASPKTGAPRLGWRTPLAHQVYGPHKLCVKT